MKISIWFFLVPYIAIQAFLFPIAKNGLEYSSPYIFMALRFVIAGSVFISLRRDLFIDRHVLVLTTGFALSAVLWILGLEYVSAGDSAVLTYTMPFFAMIISSFILEESPRRAEILGAVIGFAGVVLYTNSLYQGQFLLGALLTLGGAASWATYSVYLRKLKARNNLSVVGTMYLIGSVPLILISIPNHQLDFTTTFVLDLIYISLLSGTASVFLWSSMLRLDRVGKVTTFIFAIPASTIVIQSVLSKTIPGLLSIVGVAVMFVGMYVSSIDLTGPSKAKMSTET